MDFLGISCKIPGNWSWTQSLFQDFSSEPLEQRLKSRDLSRRCSAYSDAQVWSCPLHAKIVTSSSFVFSGCDTIFVDPCCYV